ncbi:Vegetative incompatibility protein HET-E-like protein [Hapsidospora chrysogenum ATCC 11550]|uniref:Vegetative incompatibility protein HET-E-like protein n=1 Tax=Hapsidospora chrysogenum (strain ATCC 11550 / CBS 779.69 / DSM 880 / IAM 14645 / JCM 23072 / IMI 49137) TaxID=857340 RepID=A0A086SU31_HAPC1|nr:Vegetative incompatibility protein HET-E-like protein [Hapsidospora chrysogenum ATCC 11550]
MLQRMAMFDHNQDPEQTRTFRPDPAVAAPASTAKPAPANSTDVIHRKTANNEDDRIQLCPEQSALYINHRRQNSRAYRSNLDSNGIVPSDLWSAAYCEAIDRLGEDIDLAILQGKNVAQLFRALEGTEKEATQETAFLRGVSYLRSIQVPLERFKLALDLASPLTSLEPTTSTVTGVVRNVSAIAISLATADLNFARQIGKMLEQISYIDDCDTLGQKAHRTDIHEALVSVYEKLLEFYKAAFEIVTGKGAALLMKMILETDRLAEIVEDFLSHADTLRKLIQKATWEIVEDIRAMLYDREIAKWLASGNMSQQTQYHASLQDLRSDQACEFLLADAKFADWYRATSSQHLVLLGNMGHGKTVSMAFLIDTLSQRNEYQIPKGKICYYYCRNDETGQPANVLSALIQALLGQLPGLKKPFYEWYKQTQASGCFDPAASVQNLYTFLEQVVGTLERPLFIAIDGLDECDRVSRIRLLKLLKSLSQKTTKLKTLLASRSGTEIQDLLEEPPCIELVSNTQRDRIIVEKTVETRLSHLSEDVRALVINMLSPMAQGSAIWTKMIVNLIELREITTIDPMRRFLQRQSLPVDLTDLYATIFHRCTANDYENKDLAGAALDILAVSRRPLSILELAWAVTLAAAPQEVTTVAALAPMVDHQRVMNLIHPFVSRVDSSDLRKRQVRLVHQSVKEFIIEGGLSNKLLPQSAVGSPATTRPSNDRRIENLETRALDICMRYLFLEEIGNIPLFSEEQVAIEELPQDVELFVDEEGPVEYNPYCTWETWEEDMIIYDPTDRGFGEFFVYASCHWPDHFGAITAEPLPALARIEDLCEAGSMRLHNWTKQNCRPGCAMKARFEFDSTLYDPLGITSLYGSEAMLRHMLQNSDFDQDKFLPQSVVAAAEHILESGDLSRLGILSESTVGCKLRGLEIVQLILRVWSYPRKRHDTWDPAFNLVDHVLDELVQEQSGNELLCMAASAGCMPIVRRLMTGARHRMELQAELLRATRRGQLPSSLGRPLHQSIGEAVFGNHVEVVKYLLGEKGIEAHLHHLNSRDQNVLHLAAKHCNPAMFRLLVPRFREGIHQKDNRGDTPLVRIIKSPSKGRYDSASILLSQGGASGSITSRDEVRDALQLAAQLGDSDMCDLITSICE